MAMPNNSSVMKKDIINRWKKGIFGSMRWLMAQLIRRYLALAISVMVAISKKEAAAAITVKPAYSPAEAWHRALVINAWNGVSPAFFAAIPREKATAK